MYIHTTKEGQEESDEDQFRFIGIYTRLSAKKQKQTYLQVQKKYKKYLDSIKKSAKKYL